MSCSRRRLGVPLFFGLRPCSGEKLGEAFTSMALKKLTKWQWMDFFFQTIVRNFILKCTKNPVCAVAQTGFLTNRELCKIHVLQSSRFLIVLFQKEIKICSAVYPCNYASTRTGTLLLCFFSLCCLRTMLESVKLIMK